MATEPITELTDEQEAMLPVYRDKWLRIGLCTEPVDREAAVSYGHRLMSFLRRRCKGVVVMDGPVHTRLAVHLLSKGREVNDWARQWVYQNIQQMIMRRAYMQPLYLGWGEARAQILRQLDGEIHQQVSEQFYGQVRTLVMNHVLRKVEGEVFEQALEQVWGKVNQYVDQKVRYPVRVLVWPCLYGHFDAYWTSYYDYVESVLGVDLGDWSIVYDATQFGPIYALAEHVVICDRPERIVMVDGRLHCEDGPAWSYRDGTKGWSIEGVAVDEQTVMQPHTQTLKQIDGEDNAEAKRIRIERYGWERYLAEKNARVVDYRRNDIEGTEESLMRCDDMALLVFPCPSTGRMYATEVDASCSTVEQAQDYLNGGRTRRIIGAT